MSKLPDLQRWCPNHWLNLQLIGDDLSIWTKGTPQRDGKSNVVLRQRTTQRRTQTTKSQQKKITKRLNICEKSLIYIKSKKTKCRGVILGQKWPKITPLLVEDEETKKKKIGPAQERGSVFPNFHITSYY
jgi:hypothetical protein